MPFFVSCSPNHLYSNYVNFQKSNFPTSTLVTMTPYTTVPYSTRIIFFAYSCMCVSTNLFTWMRVNIYIRIYTLTIQATAVWPENFLNLSIIQKPVAMAFKLRTHAHTYLGIYTVHSVRLTLRSRCISIIRSTSYSLYLFTLRQSSTRTPTPTHTLSSWKPSATIDLISIYVHYIH